MLINMPRMGVHQACKKAPSNRKVKDKKPLILRMVTKRETLLSSVPILLVKVTYPPKSSAIPKIYRYINYFRMMII